MSQENVELVRRFALQSLAPWKNEGDDYELIPEEFVDAGDRVVATLHVLGRDRGSGVEIDTRYYHIYTVRDGSIEHMDAFTQRAEALEAVGLRE